MTKQLPQKTTAPLNKSRILDDYQYGNPLHQSLKIINELFSARLIDNIARPIQKHKKEEHIQSFQQKLQSLHQYLNRILVQSTQKVTSDRGGSTRQKTRESTLYLPKQYIRSIRSIQARYMEVLMEGSLKHFDKICYLFQLKHDSSAMKLMDIQTWAHRCLSHQTSQSCC